MLVMACDGNAVHAWCVFNGADCGTSIRIQHIYSNSMRNIEATGIAIEGNVIPSFGSSNRITCVNLVFGGV